MSSLVSPTGGGALETPRPRPPAPGQVRRTRSWMLLFLLTPVCLAVVVWISVGSGGPVEPVVHPVTTPPGYRAITDAYYGYAVPRGYRPNGTWTDANGDFLYGTPAHGWVAETMLITKRRPAATTAPPASFEAFGERKPTPFRVSGGHPVRVADTTFAYEVDITRPGGWHAVAVDTWLRDSSTQMWLLVHAPPAVTRTVVASLRGS